MMWAIITIVLAVGIVLGGMMTLLRSAKKLKTPDNVKPQPYEDDEEDKW